VLVVGGCWNFGSGLNDVTWAIRSFDPHRNENPVQFENRHILACLKPITGATVTAIRKQRPAVNFSENWE
jgi:hypothetical protein